VDDWTLSFCTVELVRRPVGTDILDYRVQANADGNLGIVMDLKESLVCLIKEWLVAKLYSDEQLSPDGEWKVEDEVWTGEGGGGVTHCLVCGTVDTTKLWSACCIDPWTGECDGYGI
jgi:hypothetical protein